MHLRLAVGISLVAALVAVPAAAHAAVVRPFSVTASTVVPRDGTGTVTLDCAPKAVALSAAVTRNAPGVTVRRSTPGRESGDWSFRLAAAKGATRRGARLEIRCLRLAVPPGVSGVRLDVKTRLRSRVPIPAGGTASFRLGCGPAWVATGYGFDADRAGNVRLASAVPEAHGWRFALENTGAAGTTAGVSARCLRQTVSATRGGSSAQLRFRVARNESANTLGPGKATFSHSCAANQFSLATGSMVDPLASIELAGSAPAGKLGGRWTFRRARGGDEVRSFLLCLSRRSGFS